MNSVDDAVLGTEPHFIQPSNTVYQDSQPAVQASEGWRKVDSLLRGTCLWVFCVIVIEEVDVLNVLLEGFLCRLVVPWPDHLCVEVLSRDMCLKSLDGGLGAW